MNVVLVSSNATKHLSLEMFSKYNSKLDNYKISVIGVIIDLNKEKSNFIVHLYKLAKRQRKYNGKFILSQIINIVFYVSMTKIFGFKKKYINKVPSKKILNIDNLNSNKFIQIIKENKIDVVCLLGTRIVSAKILDKLKNVKFINIHSSVPTKYRGQPAFFWEIFDGRRNVQLTIHEATKNLDSGRIIKSKIFPIKYSYNLFFCISFNNQMSENHVFELFFDSLIDIKRGKINYFSYVPNSKIMVIPSIYDTLRAQLNCLRLS